MLVAKLIVVFLYVIVGSTLDHRADRHLKNPKDEILDPPLARPESFHATGERHLQRAVLFWVIGGAVVLLVLFAG